MVNLTLWAITITRRSMKCGFLLFQWNCFLMVSLSSCAIGYKNFLLTLVYMFLLMAIRYPLTKLMLSFAKRLSLFQLYSYFKSKTSFPSHPAVSVAMQSISPFTTASSSPNNPLNTNRLCMHNQDLDSVLKREAKNLAQTIPKRTLFYEKFSSTETAIIVWKNDSFDLIGVSFDRVLKWHKHMTYIVISATKKLGCLFRVQYHFSSTFLCSTFTKLCSTSKML